MSKNFSMVPLRELLIRSDVQVEVKPEKRYKQVTVRLWGKGVILRREMVGAEIEAPKQFLVKANQFILSKIDARNGALGLIPNSLDGAIVSSDFPVFTLNSSRVIPEFLGWISKTNNFVSICRATSEGTTNRIRLREDRFLATEIPLPSLDEQQRIVARIEELAAKIEEGRRLHQEVSSDIRKTLLSEYSDLTQNVKRLPMRDVAPLKRRPVLIDLEKEYHELGIRSFGKGTFHKPPVSGAALGTKRIFEIAENDLLFNIVFAWEGAVAVAKPEDHGRVGSHRFLTCVPKKDMATSSFLCFHFLTEEGLQQLLDASPGSAGRNRTLGIEALEKIQVPVPPLRKQLRFDALQKKLNLVEQRHTEISAELNALLLSILDKAFKWEL